MSDKKKDKKVVIKSVTSVGAPKTAPSTAGTRATVSAQHGSSTKASDPDDSAKKLSKTLTEAASVV